MKLNNECLFIIARVENSSDSSKTFFFFSFFFKWREKKVTFKDVNVYIFERYDDDDDGNDFFSIIHVYIREKDWSLKCFQEGKVISEYNTMMTSFFKCMPANAIERTSCHTTDGYEWDSHFVSIVAIINVLVFFSYIS
jgi:hypothetical protein